MVLKLIKRSEQFNSPFFKWAAGNSPLSRCRPGWLVHVQNNEIPNGNAHMSSDNIPILVGRWTRVPFVRRNHAVFYSSPHTPRARRQKHVPINRRGQHIPPLRAQHSTLDQCIALVIMPQRLAVGFQDYQNCIWWKILKFLKTINIFKLFFKISKLFKIF